MVCGCGRWMACGGVRLRVGALGRPHAPSKTRTHCPKPARISHADQHPPATPAPSNTLPPCLTPSRAVQRLPCAVKHPPAPTNPPPPCPTHPTPSRHHPTPCPQSNIPHTVQHPHAIQRPP